MCREFDVTEQRCLFVVTHYCPLVGGGQSVYDAYARQRPDIFQVLTSSRDYSTGQDVPGYEAFDASASYKITRLRQTRPDIASPNPSLFERINGFLNSRRIKKKLVAEVLNICDRDDINIICVGAAEAFTWLPDALRQRTDRKIIYYTHGEEFSQRAHSEKAEEQRRQALAFSDGVIAVSNFTRDLLINRYGAHPAKVKLIHNGVEFDRFARQHPRDEAGNADKADQTKLVVAAGRMVARKGFDKLIEGWPEVLKTVPNAKLKLAGKGPIFDDLQTRIFSLGIEGSVEQLGYVPDADLVNLYQQADLFTMPNRTMADGDTEGFGLVFLEAAAAGTTSVGGCAGGATDAIVHGETGLSVNGDNPAAIADAISALLADDERRNHLADNAHAHAKQCDWRYKVAELTTYFEELYGDEAQADEQSDSHA